MPALEASSHFPLWERSLAEKISFGPKQRCLGAVIVWIKSSYSPFPLQYSQTYIFLLQWCAGNSPLGTWTSPNVPLSLVIVQSNIFQGLLDRGQEGLEPVHGPFKAHSQDQDLYVHYLIYGWARLLLGFLAYGAGSHHSQKDIFAGE